MINYFDFNPKSDDLNLTKPFVEVTLEKGAVLEFNDVNYNYIILVVKGSVQVTANRGISATMKPDHMYAFCKLCSPFQFSVLEDFQCVVLLADSLSNHVSATSLMGILSCELKECQGIPELPFNIVMHAFVQNILLVNDCGESMPADYYNIKKVEYLHYMRQLYNKQELAKFMYGILSTYSDFKMEVYANYNNAVNVEQLADSMFMTTKTFTRNFKKEFSLTPHDWILEQRLYHLNHAIVNLGTPMTQLLEEYGFASLTAFKQFCKRHDAEHLLQLVQELDDA